MFDEKLTAHMAELSKLSFTPEELTAMTKDMTDIIALMDTVCDFSPEIKPYALDAVDYEELRKDEYQDSYSTEKILEYTENVKNNSFVVPKVV